MTTADSFTATNTKSAPGSYQTPVVPSLSTVVTVADVSAVCGQFPLATDRPGFARTDSRGSPRRDGLHASNLLAGDHGDACHRT
jgi:hypothetical protein